MAGCRELDKLPENLRKSFFMDDLSNVFEEPLKIVKFQEQQEHNAFANFTKYVIRKAYIHHWYLLSICSPF